MRKDQQQKINMKRVLSTIISTNVQKKDILPVIDLYDNEGNLVPFGGISYAVLDDLLVISNSENDEMLYITKDQKYGDYNVKSIKRQVDENGNDKLQVSELVMTSDREELNFKMAEISVENKAYDQLSTKLEFSERAMESYINGDITNMTKGQFFNLSSANTIEEYIAKVDLLTTSQVANEMGRGKK